jgi:hypothetical protein
MDRTRKERLVKATIATKQNGLEVNVEDVKGKKQELLEAFHECSEGRCTCPTEEYKKLESLDIADDDDTIQLVLKAKLGEQINTTEIEKCLDYTKKRVADAEEAGHKPQQG